MSYSCYIGFKKIPAQDIQEFFVKMKSLVKDKVDEIAKDTFVLSPASGGMTSAKLCSWGDCSQADKASQERWVNRLFSYRWFYLKEQQTLCVFCGLKALYSLFDTVIYFQNSTDQDYDFETWEALDFVQPIVEKCKELTPEQINEIQGDDDLEYYRKNLDYYRRTLCYKEIWNTYFDKMLYDNDAAVYVSLFSLGYSDGFFVSSFAKKCYDLVVEDWSNYLRKEK